MDNAPLRINSHQAIILLDALEHYQAENITMMHGWTLTEDARHDIEIFTGIAGLWGTIEELKMCISNSFPENPAL